LFNIFAKGDTLLKLKYGTSSVEFDLPNTVNWQVLEKDLPFTPAPEKKILKTAISSLLSQLESIDNPPKKLLFIVPDHTRRCGLERILPVLLTQLENAFSLQIKILVANGSHVAQPEETLIDLVGKPVFDNYPVLQHDSKNDNELYFAGTTTFNTAVWLNTHVKEADFIITIGGILYHYFAGFGGGPKMLMPGVAGYETIRQNHKKTVDPKTGNFHQECYEGNITTNPVYSDLVQVLDFVPNVLSLQMALSVSGDIIYAESGPVVETQKKVCEIVAKIYSVPIKEKADIVVASAGGSPSDVNLIQTQKSIHHAFMAVKPEGHIIVLAECSEGIGSKTFMPYLEYSSSQEIGQVLLKDYKINGHTALTLRAKAERANIILVSSLEEKLVRKAGLAPADSMETAWDMVKNELPANTLGYVMEKASAIVPITKA
jgi:lactate racemase